MEIFLKVILSLSLFLSATCHAFTWDNLWQTRDQQGASLLQAGKAKEAAQIFKNKDWRSVAQYRAGDYKNAFQSFKQRNTSDGQYNAGNAAAFMGQYETAIKAYDKAIALNPQNKDAITNRDIIKKLLEKEKQQQSKNQQKQQKQQAQNQQQQQQQQEQQQAANQQQQDKPQETGTKQEEVPTVSSQLRPEDEEKKQLLRRIANDPGGLLRQKFMRDYFRRHSGGEN